MTKAPHPVSLLRGSLVSPSLEAAVLNGKYINGVPFARLEKEFSRYGLAITRQNMANWTIECAERYLGVFYDYLHRYIYQSLVIHADETSVLVRKDGRDAGSKSFMWVYCTGGGEEKAVILYEYQKTRKADHPEKFLKDYEGVCVTDGYQVYHKLAKEKGNLTVAGCWAHARRRYEEAVKALPVKSRKSSLAWQALEQINMIYHVDNTLKELTPEERKKRRQDSVKPLVEAYFAWVKEKKKDGRIAEKSKTGKGLSYSLNQEEYLKVFLENGNVPLDNNAAERAIRNFCIGRKNWVIIDTKRKKLHLKQAGFDNLKTFEGYDFDHIVIPNTTSIDGIKTLDFMSRSENLILYGRNGAGKSHMATAIGVEACMQGKKVKFYKTATLVNELTDAKSDGLLTKLLKKLSKLDLLICDEWGYLPFDAEGSQLLFQVIADCYEKRSLILTTNIEFSKWNGIFYDEQLTAALIDRLVHHSHLIIFDRDSWRFEHSLMKNSATK